MVVVCAREILWSFKLNLLLRCIDESIKNLFLIFTTDSVGSSKRDVKEFIAEIKLTKTNLEVSKRIRTNYNLKMEFSCDSLSLVETSLRTCFLQKTSLVVC